MKKYTMVFILCLFLSVCSSFVVYAEEFTSIKTGLDVIFVMDYSGSMSTNDSSNIAKGMVKAFIDTVHSADIRVGFVAYTDKILTSTSPMEIQTTEQRNVWAFGRRRVCTNTRIKSACKAYTKNPNRGRTRLSIGQYGFCYANNCL